ncbi:MAG: nodulation protein NfeD [Candidatus Omnitrophota bacterium]
MIGGETKKTFFILWLSFSLASCAFSQKIKIAAIEDYIINPLTVNYIRRALDEAKQEDAILILKLDTPGGLLKSTEEIVKLLLNSPVPVVTYITPQGAKAVSAGTFISYASHILAMSPSTHIGAAHPVLGQGSWGELSDEIKEKLLNNTLAWAETIANKRKRPLAFIKDAIEKSSSITEEEALKEKICDLIAKDTDELIALLNGKTVSTEKGDITLVTENSKVEDIHMNYREKTLNAVIDPNIAYLLFILGFLGLIFEVTHPGFGFPGIAGIICLILAFYAFSILPLNYAGLTLIILSIVFFVVESFTPTFGMFAFGGVLALFFGSLMVFNQPAVIKVSLKMILPVIAFFLAFSVLLLGKIIKAQSQKSRLGKDGLIGEEGTAHSDIDKQGTVLIHGEIWSAVSQKKIEKGERVYVDKIKGLTLFVSRAKQENDEKQE